MFAAAGALHFGADAEAPLPRAPHIWAVPGLYGLERTNCDAGAATTNGGETAMVAPAFCPGLDSAARQRIGDGFAAAMAAHFPGVEAHFAQNLPADATPHARLAASLIASLTLSRATIWRIDKQVGTDTFLPITLTLAITNAATGEVVFSRTRSQIASGSFAPGTVDTELAAQLPAKLDAAMQALVADAATGWKPSAQIATVVGKAGDDWIVDRGRAQGLRTGDAIGDAGSITYAGASYAVVRPTLGIYAIGQQLTRTTAAPVEMLTRPSVLVVMDAPPADYAKPYLTTMFEDALGDHANLAPMPINPAFASLRDMALSKAQAPSTDGRSLPDYVAVVHVALLPSASFASNIPGVAIERHDARAFVTLVDRSGRAVFAVQGIGRIVDQISGDTRFSIDQRHDTAIHNALVDAATKLAAFRPQPLTLPVTRSGEQIMIADAGGALPLGAQVAVLRDIGGVKGVTGPIRIPVGQLTTREVTGGGVIADNADLVPLAVHSGDVVAIEQVGPALQARRPMMQCLDGTGQPTSDDRGTVPVPFWPWLAATGFVSHYHAPIEVAGLAGRLADFDAYFANWDRFAPAKVKPAETCFLPVIAVSAAAAARHGATYQLTVGYTLMRGPTKLTGSGVQVSLTPTALPADASAPAVSAMLQQDLADQLSPLADRAASALTSPM